MAFPRCEILIFLFFNCPKVNSEPVGMKIGSYPHPGPLIFEETLPSDSPTKVRTVLSSLYTKTETKDADLSLMWYNSFRIPGLPIVLKTKDELGPGKPFNRWINSPSSSIITGLDTALNAYFDFSSAISLRESA